MLPEFLQWNCKPKRIVAAIDELIENESRRRDVIEAEIAVVRQLTLEDQTPSERAAQAVLRIIDEFEDR